MVESNVIKDLVAIVPGVQRSVSRVVVEHGQVAIFVGKRNINVLVGGGVGGVGVVNFSSSRVTISNVEGSTDHESLASTAFRVVGGPAADYLQSVWI